MVKLEMPPKAKKLHLEYFQKFVLPRMKRDGETDNRYKSAFNPRKLGGTNPEAKLIEELGCCGKSIFDYVIDFFLTIDDDTQKEIWQILAIGDASELMKVKKKLEQNVRLLVFLSSASKDEKTRFYKAIENVFDYRKFSARRHKRPNLSDGGYWAADVFIDCLNLHICPYCNQEYIYSVRSKRRKVRPEIDHFMPKSLYPYFSMSLYNFVPAGKSCNQDFKRAECFAFDKYAYPYRDDYDKSFTVAAVLENLGDMGVSICLAPTEYGKEHRIGPVLETLQLQERYVTHAHLAREFIIRLRSFPEGYINDIVTYGYHQMGMAISKKEMKAILFGYPANRKDIDSYMLGKLKRDLAKQFGLIEA